MNKKGFTLIELLAVIIILGVLLLVAIPSVTTYINNSRKEAYITTAKEYIKGATNLVNSGDLDVFNPEATYYIPTSCVALETGGESPYGGKFSPAYIVVTYDNNSYNYYWMSRDENGIGIRKPINSNKLKTDLIESSIKANEIEPVYAIDGRSTIIEFKEDDCKTAKAETQATGFVPGEESSGNATISYPNGQDNLHIGDIVTINGEDFYIYKFDNNSIYLLARYNLNIGTTIKFDHGRCTKLNDITSADSMFGRQSENSLGYNGDFNAIQTMPGSTTFSTTGYWDSNGSPKTSYGGSYSHPDYPYVFDSNSNLYSYVTSYASSLGVPVKEARLISYQELMELGCTSDRKCANAPDFLFETTSWIGNARNANYVWALYRGYKEITHIVGGSTPGYKIDCGLGLRPVIVIDR